MRRLACAFAVAAAAIVACGTTGDQKLEQARRGICDRAVGKTVADVSNAWGYRPDLLVQCGTDVRLRGTGNCDAAAPRCLVTWKEVFLTNGTDCNPVGGCAYMCEAFTPQPATGPTQNPDDVAGETICATLFSTGQIPVLGLGGP
jgi:hypothetical protein